MLIRTKDGWVRMEPSVVIPVPRKVEVGYWWLGLCPINPKDEDR